MDNLKYEFYGKAIASSIESIAKTVVPIKRKYFRETILEKLKTYLTEREETEQRKIEQKIGHEQNTYHQTDFEKFMVKDPRDLAKLVKGLLNEMSKEKARIIFESLLENLEQ